MASTIRNRSIPPGSQHTHTDLSCSHARARARCLCLRVGAAYDGFLSLSLSSTKIGACIKAQRSVTVWPRVLPRRELAPFLPHSTYVRREEANLAPEQLLLSEAVHAAVASVLGGDKDS